MLQVLERYYISKFHISCAGVLIVVFWQNKEKKKHKNLKQNSENVHNHIQLAVQFEIQTKTVNNAYDC